MEKIKKYFCCYDDFFSRLIYWKDPWRESYDKVVEELKERSKRLERERIRKILLIVGVAVFFLWVANRKIKN